MLGRRLLFTSLVLLIVLASAPALDASSRPRVGEPAPLEAPLAGMQVGSQIQLSPDGSANRWDPELAYNYVHHEYLVVWSNNWSGGNQDIYARRVSRTGELLSCFCITTGVQDRFWPAVAYNATNDEYLVIWMYEASTLVYEIWGKIIPWNGPGTNPEFRIMQWDDRSFWTPRVAWNSNRNEYLVIWNAFDISSGTPGVQNDIGGYRVSDSGTVYEPDWPIIITTTSLPQQADLAYNATTDEYLVVWVRVNTTTGDDIYGARVEWNGDVVAPPGEFEITDSSCTQDTTAPAVATNNDDRYVVAWEYEAGVDDHDIHITELDAQGNLQGTKWLASVPFQSLTNPDVAAAPGANEDYFLVWQQTTTDGEAVWGWRLSPGASTIPFEIASWASSDCRTPAVDIGRPGYLIAYTSWSPFVTPPEQHIYARMFWPEVVHLPLVPRNY